MELPQSFLSDSSLWHNERQELLKVAKKMHHRGLVVESNGNVSLRVSYDDQELIAITASRVPYESMTLEHIVVVDHEGEPIVGDAIPSSELLMHSAIYHARKDVKSNSFGC